MSTVGLVTLSISGACLITLVAMTVWQDSQCKQGRHRYDDDFFPLAGVCSRCGKRDADGAM